MIDHKQKIGLLFLTALLLFATVGVTISKHYCVGRLMSIEINDHTHGCEGEGEEKMPCCEDTTEELRLEQIQKTTFDLDILGQAILIHEINYLLVDIDPSEVDYPPTDAHAPSLIARDIPILVQSFLI
ncbi:MAG: hypothetical protein AAGC88_13170 [Bacteroidota bacterium]